MVNYQLGKIYKITCEKTGNVYIGSTTKRLLCQRLAEHINKYKEFMKAKRKISYMSSYEIIKHNMYSISLLENYPCSSRCELTERENHYIRTIECVNVYGKNIYVNGSKDKETLAIKLIEERQQYWDKQQEEYKDLEKQKKVLILSEPYYKQCSIFRKIDLGN